MCVAGASQAAQRQRAGAEKESRRAAARGSEGSLAAQGRGDRGTSSEVCNVCLFPPRFRPQPRATLLVAEREEMTL